MSDIQNFVLFQFMKAMHCHMQFCIPNGRNKSLHYEKFSHLAKFTNDLFCFCFTISGNSVTEYLLKEIPGLSKYDDVNHHVEKIKNLCVVPPKEKNDKVIEDKIYKLPDGKVFRNFYKNPSWKKVRILLCE